jgi:hypothetical protein
MEEPSIKVMQKSCLLSILNLYLQIKRTKTKVEEFTVLLSQEEYIMHVVHKRKKIIKKG